jgi:hypothetical protein
MHLHVDLHLMSGIYYVKVCELVCLDARGLCVCLCVCQSVSLSVCVCVCLSVCLSVCLRDKHYHDDVK